MCSPLSSGASPGAIFDANARLVVSARRGQRPLGAQIECVRNERAEVTTAGIRVGFQLEVVEAHSGAIVGELRLLRELTEARLRDVRRCAERELVLPPTALTRKHELQAAAITVLIDVGRIVRGLNVIVVLELVVHVAADVACLVVAVIEIAAEQDIVAQKVAAFRGEKRQLVLVLIGEGIGLLDVVEEREGQGLRALQFVVRASEAHIEVAGFILPADFAEVLPHLARVVVCPAIIVVNVAGQKPVEHAALAAPFELPPFGDREEPPESWMSHRDTARRFSCRSQPAPPSVFRPNAGLDPGMS